MDAYSSIYSYPIFPLQMANPMTDTSIVTEGNISYSKHTSRVAAEEDQEYTYMGSEVSSALPQPYLCRLTCYREKCSIFVTSITLVYLCSTTTSVSHHSHIYTLLYTAPATCLNQSPSTEERDLPPVPSQGQGSESGNDVHIYDN